MGKFCPAIRLTLSMFWGANPLCRFYGEVANGISSVGQQQAGHEDLYGAGCRRTRGLVSTQHQDWRSEPPSLGPGAVGTSGTAWFSFFYFGTLEGASSLSLSAIAAVFCSKFSLALLVLVYPFFPSFVSYLISFVRTFVLRFDSLSV